MKAVKANVKFEKENQKKPRLFTEVFSRTSIHPGIFILVQYSDKFMHSIVLYSIVLRRSQLYCFVNLLLCGYNAIQCYV